MNELGVEKGKVRVVSFDHNWVNQFEAEQKFLSLILKIPSGNIFHFGSTSIPNCNAKPIIDMAIPYQRLADSFTHQKVLIGTSYGLNNIYYLKDTICYTKGKPQTHHLYLIAKDSPTFINWICFKKVLSENPKLIEEYSLIKENLAREYPNDRIKYTEQKSRFIYSILKNNNEWQERILLMKS